MDPLAGLPFTDTMSPMAMNVMKFLTFGVSDVGNVTSLDGSARSSIYTTPFSHSISKVATRGACAQARPKATAQKTAVRVRFQFLVIIFPCETDLPPHHLVVRSYRHRGALD